MGDHRAYQAFCRAVHHLSDDGAYASSSSSPASPPSSFSSASSSRRRAASSSSACHTHTLQDKRHRYNERDPATLLLASLARLPNADESNQDINIGIQCLQWPHWLLVVYVVCFVIGLLLK
eukprot:NODE_2633_length_1021_cov_47.450783_g2614_i0.p1 GENE.NODE_2633_length_1021_cov_47.450783_g2614_i0~~NODE_2633_length_1021_cov_47.450783_g2614_i0.p1  ORF type:complete len:121 (-),score=9.38 NODE_2633_length_1021_cov_47.450783_g2614_i0:377-739(-)